MAFRSRFSGKIKRHISLIFNFGILFQIAIIYFTSAITKTGEFWRSGKTVLSLTQDYTHTIGLGHMLMEAPAVCTLLTYATLVFEFAIPLLIFIPIKTKSAKLLAGILIFLIHWGLATTIYVGPFNFISLAFTAILLPDYFYKKIRVLNQKNKESFTLFHKRNIASIALLVVLLIFCAHIFLVNLQNGKPIAT